MHYRGTDNPGDDVKAPDALLDAGADLDWLPPREDLTPLDAAGREQATDLVGWLRDRGARSATELATGSR